MKFMVKDKRRKMKNLGLYTLQTSHFNILFCGFFMPIFCNDFSSFLNNDNYCLKRISDILTVSKILRNLGLKKLKDVCLNTLKRL